jgi:hypothetical protein
MSLVICLTALAGSSIFAGCSEAESSRASAFDCEAAVKWYQLAKNVGGVNTIDTVLLAAELWPKVQHADLDIILKSVVDRGTEQERIIALVSIESWYSVHCPA